MDAKLAYFSDFHSLLPKNLSPGLREPKDDYTLKPTTGLIFLMLFS
jgi:hypothetical protein